MFKSNNKYDELPYLTSARRKASPDCIATVSSLLGHKVNDPSKSRILEIGCGTGEHIITIASSYPESYCLGVDLSPVQINMGLEFIKKLQLENIELSVSDFNNLKAEKFDYIIAHGLMSWIPINEQKNLLETIQKHLTNEGIAYISYNTFPGWHEKKIIREIMLGASNLENNIVERAKAGLLRLSQAELALKNDTSAYSVSIQEHHKKFQKLPIWYIAHEYMEPNNNPFYFEEFSSLLNTCSLEFLGEINLDSMIASNYPATFSKILEKEENLIKREQLSDYFLNRSFRESLIRKKLNFKNKINTLEAVSTMWIRAQVDRTPKFDTKDSFAFQFKNNTNIGISDSIHEKALQKLSKSWPAAVSFTELVSNSLNQKDVNAKNLADLSIFLSSIYTKNLLELFFSNPKIASISDKPLISELARHQINTSNTVTNSIFENVDINDEVCKKLFPLLDGKKTKFEIAKITDLDINHINDALKKLSSKSLLTF